MLPKCNGTITIQQVIDVGQGHKQIISCASLHHRKDVDNTANGLPSPRNAQSPISFDLLSQLAVHSTRHLRPSPARPARHASPLHSIYILTPTPSLSRPAKLVVVTGRGPLPFFPLLGSPFSANLTASPTCSQISVSKHGGSCTVPCCTVTAAAAGPPAANRVSTSVQSNPSQPSARLLSLTATLRIRPQEETRTISRYQGEHIEIDCFDALQLTVDPDPSRERSRGETIPSHHYRTEKTASEPARPSCPKPTSASARTTPGWTSCQPRSAPCAA